MQEEWDSEKRKLVTKLTREFPSKIIPATLEGTVEKRDLLG